MRAVKDEFGLYREKLFDDMVEIPHLIKSRAKKSIRALATVLNEQFREIDIQGWYRHRSVIGIICPEVVHENVKALQLKIENAIEKTLPADFRSELSVSCICFPEVNASPESGQNLSVYPEFKPSNLKKTVENILKRGMDITIAVIMLAFAFPLFLLFSLMIKIDSPGPVFFRQKRVGFGGRQFTFLKFRSMYVDNDDSVHKAFIKDYINAKNSEVPPDTKTFKIVKDARVTPMGRFLRKTSLDELPQLINVLRGEMSLVGPRPCIPYEFDEYRIWHRRRVLEVKPGITGFWQVYGRSITSFESMVRMDIHYIKYRNLFLDIILLLKTPLSLFKGAY